MTGARMTPALKIFAVSAFTLMAVPALAQDAAQSGAVEQSGAALYVEKCGMCHREADRVGGMGTFLILRRDPDNPAMLEQRGTLTPEYVSAAIRAGIGNMPRISRAEVSDAQLAAISAYLVESAASYAPPPLENSEQADPIQ